MSAYPSLISPLMNSDGLISKDALSTETQTALDLSTTNNEEIVVLQNTTLQISGEPATYTGATGVNMNIDGDIYCETLHYTTLDPPISSATPSLLDVLDVDNSAGNKEIKDVGILRSNFIYSNSDITSYNGYVQGRKLGVQGTSGYHTFQHNASGVDLDTKLTSDGLILHKVGAGSDITIQNDENNNITLGTATGLADLTISTLHYTTLDPPISSSGRTLSEVLTAGNDASSQSMVNISSIEVGSISCDGGSSTIDSYGVNAKAFGIPSVYNPAAFGITSGGDCTASSFTSNFFRNYGETFSVDTNGYVYATDFYADNNIRAEKVILSRNSGTAICFKNDGETFKVDGNGDLTCQTLHYSILDPAIPPPAVPTLEDVLNVGNSVGLNSIDMNGQAIQNAGSLSGDSVYCSDLRSTTGTLPINVVNNLQFATGKGIIGTIKSLAEGKEDAFENSDNSFSVNAIGEILASSIQVGLSGGSGAINGKSVDAQNTIHAGGQIISDTGFKTNSESFSVDNSGNLICNTINNVDITYKPSYEYFVSKNGSDSGLGSVLSPFLSISHALSVISNDTNNYIIHVGAGSFTENLTFTRSRITIKGLGVGFNEDVGTSITGNVSIALTYGNSDMNNNNIFIDGLLINGNISDTTSNNIPHRVNITNCYIYGNGYCLSFNPTPDYRFNMNNCNVSNSSSVSTTPLCDFHGIGMITLVNCGITAKGVQSVLQINDTVRTDKVALCSFSSDNSSSSLPPIVQISPTGSNSIVRSFGQCSFIYSSTTAKTNANGSAGLKVSAPIGSAYPVMLIQNFFSLAGLADIEHCVETSATGSGVFLYGNNVSASSAVGTSAYKIAGTNNTTKFALTAVQ